MQTSSWIWQGKRTKGVWGSQSSRLLHSWVSGTTEEGGEKTTPELLVYTEIQEQMCGVYINVIIALWKASKIITLYAIFESYKKTCEYKKLLYEN